MKRIYRLPLILVLSIFWFIAGCRTTGPVQDVITVTGEVWTRGNAPFAALVLTTDQDNHYVLINNTTTQLKHPSTARITGRVYTADWNGQPFAHLDIIEVEPITNESPITN